MKYIETLRDGESVRGIYLCKQRSSAMTKNGKPYDKSYITYQDIINGSTLKFVMGKKPNKNFGKAPANRPVVLNKING